MGKYLTASTAVLVSSFMIFFLAQYQDSDLVLRFYEYFGAEPCSVLKGKVVWITGASSGIGEQLAYDLAECDCKLVLSARTKHKLEQVKNRVAEIGRKRNPFFNKDERVLVLPLDVTSFSSHVNITNQVIDRFGHIDFLVNNAGVSQMPKFSEDIPFEVEEKLLNINLIGAISLSKAVIPYMVKRKQGQIVLVGSIFSKIAYPGYAAYCASKSGLRIYFDAIRYELSSSNIKVVHVLPGPVVSNILDNAFTDTVNVTARDHSGFKDFTNHFTFIRFMETKRFTYLMTVAMANNLKESWMANVEILTLVYLSHYLPFI